MTTIWGSLSFFASAVTVADHTAAGNMTAARMRKCHQVNAAYSCRRIPMRRAASDPAVPGALGERPHPNHVERRIARRVLIEKAFWATDEHRWKQISKTP